MSTIKEVLKENRKSVVFYIITGLLIAFLTNYKIKLFQQIIDAFTNRTITISIIFNYGIVLISYYLLNYIDEYPAKKLENGIYLDFKILALKKLSRIQYIEYQSLGIGKLTQKIENGANAGKEIVFDFWLCLFRQLIPTIFFSIFFIWRMNHFITYIILGGYIIVFILTKFLLKFLYGIKEKILFNEELMNHYLVRGFMEMVVFRLNRSFKGEILKAVKAKNEIVSSKVKMNMIHEAFFTLFALLTALLNIGMLIYAWLNPSISIGTTVALISLLENAYTPIAIFNVLFVQFKLNNAAFKKYEDFFNMKDDTQLEIGTKKPIKHGNISIENLSFDYNQKTIFKNINLNIKLGEKVALVGSSGSGKTTLVKLILGLLKYDHGRIKIDEYDLKEMCLDSLYENISYISQEAPVFDGTIKENILFNQDANNNELQEVLTKVKLDDLISKMNQGVDTLIGERGTSLSGGERQRLALARLWFRKNNIVILDEATSALDNITEDEVMKELMSLLSQNTVIAIAHRLSSIKDFDRIIVFQDGQIVEQGTFDELLKEGLYFTDLYEKSLYNNI